MELIDRRAVIDLIDRYTQDMSTGYRSTNYGIPSDVFEDEVMAQPTIQPEKAQLFQQGTTSDLISRTETVEHLRRVLEATVPNTEYDEGYIDGIEFGINTVSTLPTIQPVATDTNVGDTISRQSALEKVRAMQTYKLFMGDDMILVDKAELQTELMMLPPIQPEPKEGHWIPHESPDGGEQYECSECGVLWEFNDGTTEDNESYYCPKCGAKMQGEQT